MPKIERIFSVEKLKRMGFKRKWSSDKSAYWWSKRVKHPVFGQCELILDNFVTIDRLVLMKNKSRRNECMVVLKCTINNTSNALKLFGIAHEIFWNSKSKK